MAGESQLQPESVPDPTVLTTDAIARAIKAERDRVDAQLDVLRQRLSDMDRANEVLSETVNRTPTDIQREVSHLKELADEKIKVLSIQIEERFKSVELQFSERDIRQEREARDNRVAVDAAFAAQKEAAAKQNESNTLAIAKSEAATAETINKLAELFRSTTDALADKIEDVRARLTNLEAVTR